MEARLDTFDPLAALDADRVHAGDERPSCSSTWPLLAVPGDALSAGDRELLDGHLAACTRCRVVAMETWLDGEVAPAKRVAVAALPVALAAPRSRPRRRLAWVSAALAAAAAAAAFVVVPLAADGDVAVTAGAPAVEPVLAPAPAPAEPPPLAVAVVYPGTWTWMGNSRYDAFAADRVVGAYMGMVRAFDMLGETLPDDALVGALRYASDGTLVQRPMRAVGQMNGAVIGDQTEYRNHIGTGELGLALDSARLMLRDTPMTRRVVIVVGNGCDVRPDEAIEAMQLAKERLIDDGIEVHAIFFPEEINPDGCPENLRILDPGFGSPASSLDIGWAMRAALAQLSP